MKDILPESAVYDAGDIEIQYLRYAGDGPCLVLLHATGFMPWIWHPIARNLSGYFSIIAPYFCDHRVAEPEAGGLSWDVLANDLCLLLKGLGLNDVFLAGHSMGATVATIAAVLDKKLFNKMLLIEPIYLPSQFYTMDIGIEQHPLAWKALKRKNDWIDFDEARHYMRSKKLFSSWDGETLELYLKYGMISGEGGGLKLSCPPKREASLFMGGLHSDPWPLLPEVECPVLVVEGGESENRHYIDLKKASGFFRNGGYMLMEGAGHMIPMERPAEISGIIKQYLIG
ncbi:MAG: alpha/beta hydrolase [Spirochaetes bacterium]|jgi:pimeloyl-ACP methyl ester carboxylesterase|nr:alpha/beta hydrolase [Spirochaetota bacterium]